MPKRLPLRHLLQWVLKRPVAVLSAVTAITLLFAWHLPGLSFRTSVYDMVIEDLPANQRYEEFKAVFGSDEIIRVVIKSKNVFDTMVFEKITDLSDKASQIEGVRRVISLPVIRKAVDASGKWSMERFAEVVAPVRLFQQNLISEDSRTTALTLVLEDKADRENVIEGVNKIFAEASADVKLYQIGMPLVSQALARFTAKDFTLLPPIAFLVIAAILFFLFRNITCLLLPLLSVLLTLVWTLGLMAMTGIPISMLLMIVPVFLIAVGTAYCLHVVSEYIDAATRAGSPAEAVVETFSSVAAPTALAVLTTIIGLGSLMVNRITAIREFAAFSCFGMFCLLILVLTFFPAALSLLPLPLKKKKGENAVASAAKDRLLDRFLAKVADINLNHQKISLSIIGVFVIFCCFGIMRLDVQTNPVGFFKKSTVVSQNFHDIYQDLSGSFPINVSMGSKDEDYFEDPEHIADIASFQQFLETLPDVDKTISFADYMMLVNYVMNKFKAEYYRLPQKGFEVRMIMNNYKIILGEDMFTRFMKPDYSRTNIVMLTHIEDSRQFLANRDLILAHVADNYSKDLQWDVTGFGMVISESSHQLTRGQVKSLSLTMVLVFGMMFLLFLSWKAGLIAIIPNMFPIIVNFGLMGWLGIELSMATALIASIAIGLAVDDTIHYLVRFNREFKIDLDEEHALRVSIAKVGRPIIFTTLCIAVGFSILIFSSFKPTAIFGLMLMITMLSALVGDLILLPSLMLHVELVTLWDLVRNRTGKEPDKGIPLFKGLSRAQVQSILMAKQLKPFDNGAVLFRKGDPSDSMYAIISGELDILYPLTEDPSDPNYGTHKRINTIGPGDVVGEMGLLREVPRSATVMAANAGELLQINWKMIERLHWLYPPTAQKFFRNLMGILCDRVEYLSTCLSDGSMDRGICDYYPKPIFLDVLAKEIHRADRRQDSLSLGVMNICLDDQCTFQEKAIIDQIIVDLENTLSPNIRRTDTLGRWDLQTLALIMPHTGLSDGRSHCRRLAAAIEKKLAELRSDLKVKLNVIDWGADRSLSGPELMDLALKAL